MNNMQKPEQIIIDNWTFRIKQQHQTLENNRVILLLHGYMGNENSMWILADPLPDTYTIIAPRAPVKQGKEQFSWHEIEPQWPNLLTYKDLADKLINRVTKWLDENSVTYEKLDVMGFSQGAVMAYALSFLHPNIIGKVAALASFIPQTWRSEINLEVIKRRQYFIAHGKYDEIIPIKKALNSAEWLEENGAEISFCEAEIGHKLSAGCFKGLGEYFQ